ncbi:MAG: NAD-dependent epimerase/dehydratase family protein [Pseudomonadota bacterium]
MNKKIALTGGTGFVGAALINAFLDGGAEIKALARTPSKLSDWKDRVSIVEGDINNPDALGQLAQGCDIFIHCAGVTHVRDDDDFHAINVDGAKEAARAAANAGAKMVHLSSMSAREPSLSPYAASKRASEAAVAEANAISLRLPAIYGLRDTATLPYFKLVKAGLAPEPATQSPARASILFVEDAAAAVARAADAALTPGVYEVADDRPQGYSWTEIGETLGAVMGKKPRKIRAPRPILSGYHAVARRAALLMGKTPDVRTGQIREFFHTDWVARDPLFNDAASWAPAHSLKEGFAKTVQWYQEHGYL